MTTVIFGARVVNHNGVQEADILIEDGTISAVEPYINAPADHRIDASGCVAFPGFIDMHVHVDAHIGGFQLADDYASAGKVALCSGITTFFSFVTPAPGESLSAALSQARSRAAQQAWCNIGMHCSPLNWQEASCAETDALVAAGQRSFKFYTTYREAGLMSSYAQIEAFAQRYARKNIVILVHCEDDAILHSHARKWQTTAQYAALRNAEAEITAIEHIIEICRKTGCPMHVVHVSTAEGARRIRDARQHCPISCETAPHYLTITDQVFHNPHAINYLCTPPIRDEANRVELAELLHHNAFDALATDHCPFWMQDKDQPNLDAVPKGLCGIDWLVPLAFQQASREGQIDLPLVCRVLSHGPARVLNLPTKGSIAPGFDADIALMRIDQPYSLPSRPGLFNPYTSFTSPVHTEAVWQAGVQVVQKGQLCAPTPQGALL
jgi:dihydropyrimidinase